MHFVDFWKGFNPKKHWLCSELENVEGVCYSVFGNRFSEVQGSPRIFFSAENFWEQEDRFRLSDYSFSHHMHDDPELGHVITDHTRILNFTAKLGPRRVVDLIQRRLNKSNDELRQKTRNQKPYCTMVNRRRVEHRVELFHALNDSLGVVSAGSLLNNTDIEVPWGWDNLREFESGYMFALVTENLRKRGYTTEKLFNALLASTIPIYLGDPDVSKHFNTDAFIDYADFDTDQALLDHVLEVAENEDMRMQYLLQPMVLDKHMNGIHEPAQYEDAINRVKSL